MLTNKTEIFVHIIFGLTVSFFLGFGFIIEDPYLSRGGKLLLFSLAFLAIVVIMYFLRDKKNESMIGIIILTGILILIEYYSKFSLNYLYHVLYFMITLLVVFYIQGEVGIILAGVVTFSSFIKFIQLIFIETTQANISNFIFYAVIQILLITTIYIAKAYYSKSSKTKDLYRQLLDAYQKLNEYSHDIELLSAKEERSSIARDLHDTLGHELTGLIMQLELSNYNIEEGRVELGREYLVESIQNARNSLTKVRAIVDTLKNQEKLVFAKQSLTDLVNDYMKRTNIHVDLNMIKEETVLPDELLLLYRIIQEALTNTAKHSQSNYISIDIEYIESSIHFTIHDYRNKTSIFRKNKVRQSIVKGNGLNGIEERLEEVNGTVEFIKYTGNNSGFEIKGIIPKRMEKL